MVNGVCHLPYSAVIVNVSRFSSFVFRNQLRVVRIVNIVKINVISKSFHS